MEKKLFKISGMHCASCASRIENALKKTDGVKSAVVNFASEKVTVEYDPKKINEDKLREIVAEQGEYKLITSREQPESHHGLGPDLKLKVVWGAIFAGISLFFSLVYHLPILAFVATTPVVFWIGKDFYVTTWRDIKRFSFGKRRRLRRFLFPRPLFLAAAVALGEKCRATGATLFKIRNF